MNLFKHVRVLEVFGSVGFWGEGKTGIPGEPTTNSTHIWRWCRNLNPDHIGGRRVLSPMCHPLLPKHIFLILGVSTETFSTKMRPSKCPLKKKKKEESWTFKSANKLVLGTWHTGLNLYFSLIQSLTLKQGHKTGWNNDKWHNDELGLNTLSDNGLFLKMQNDCIWNLD